MRGCATIITDCRLLRHFLQTCPSLNIVALAVVPHVCGGCPREAHDIVDRLLWCSRPEPPFLEPQAGIPLDSPFHTSLIARPSFTLTHGDTVIKS